MDKIFKNLLSVFKAEKNETEKKISVVEDGSISHLSITTAGQLKKSAPIKIPKKEEKPYKKVYAIPNEKEVGQLFEMHASIQRVTRLNCQPAYPYELSDYSIYELQNE